MGQVNGVEQSQMYACSGTCAEMKQNNGDYEKVDASSEFMYAAALCIKPISSPWQPAGDGNRDEERPGVDPGGWAPV